MDLKNKYDIMLLRLPTDRWFNITTTENKALLLEAVEYWHRANVMSFSVNADKTKIRKDFNIDTDFIAGVLK